MSNWYEFKKLYSASNTDDCIFKAYIADKDTYRVIIDDGNLFTDIFLAIINGNYVISPMVTENDTEKYEYLKINSQDAVMNLRQYIEMIDNNDVRQRFILQETNIISVLSVQFKGPDFNYHKGMNPYAVNKANKLVYSILKSISNDDKMQEQFLFSKAGSLIYDIHMPEDNIASNMDNIKQLLLHINNDDMGNINNMEYNNIIKNLYELTKIQNIDSLNVVFHENESININLENVIKVYSNINCVDKTVCGIPDRYSNANNSFKIGKYVCKIYKPAQEYITKIKCASDNRDTVEVKGLISFDHEYTILVTEITINNETILFDLEE